ncbi:MULTISPECIES: acyltransferase domain-containing protein [unclassified Streptomyces]|uniref:acyltransferase domain-containing protein n=1 Tax=unclassified Streptomyces TaxID=2593676 RepID=UPI0033287910
MSRPAPGPRPVALLLPGQGSQYARMAAGLLPSEPVFARAMDEVFTALGDRGRALRVQWLAERPEPPCDDAAFAQPLLFAVDYALGRLVLSWGIRPVALLGHSVGEVAAAVLAGVFRIEDAARLVADRVSRAARAEAGGMLAVAATAARLEPYLGDGVVIGAVNAPLAAVLAGPEIPLAKAAWRLASDGFACRRVASATAFHSPLMEPVLEGAEQLIAAAGRRAPALRVHSGYTAVPLSAEEAVSPAYWAYQPARPVLFWPALDTLLAEGDRLLLEVGPGQGLATFARRHKAVRTGRSTVAALSPARPGGAEADRQALERARDTLRAEGYGLDG